MPAFRPLIALIAALSLLVALPVAGAEAKPKPSSSKIAKQGKAKKKKHRKRKHGHKRHNQAQSGPASGAEAGPIGTVTEVDGDLVTVTLTRGGSVSAEVTEATEGACATGDDEELDDSDFSDDDLADDEADDDPDDVDEDLRSARLSDDCAAAVGAPVYALTVEDGVYDVLDLTA